MSRIRRIALAIHTSHSFYRGVVRGVARQAHHHPDWHLQFLRPACTASTRQILEQVDGVITCIDRLEWCEFLMETGVPIVNIDAVLPDLPLPRLNLDDQLIGQVAAEHFMERGFRSFGFVGQRDLLFSQEREIAFRGALTLSGQTLSVFDAHGDQDIGPMSSLGSTFEDLCDWLRSLPFPVGILAPDDLWGAEIIEACRQASLRVPEDVAVLGVDNDDLFCTICEPSLSSVIVPAEAVGVEAVNQVDKLLKKNRRTLEHDILLPPIGIAVRKSTDFLAVDDPDVLAAMHFIRGNIHRPIQVADVLRAVSVSRRALEYKVVEVLGVTLGVAIRRIRLERAKQLLIETNIPIAKISMRTGYSDLRQLELAFRKALAMTPSQFRARAAGAEIAR